ncbi:MAG: glycoside hydrolase family 97 N-terminal domain-containing protein, partial [Candidatus Phocaeicola merdigallinarum]|nr:glycoside hydrolase family 97 N-terminal domain-containing protein [Candidatus Phocaeicola merdigallinarum]
MKQLTLFSLLFAGAVQAFAQQAVVTGPDSRLKLDFQLQDGKPVYSVTYDGKTVLENSPLGFVSNIGDFSRQMTFVDQQTDKVDKTYAQTRIKRSTVHYAANKLTVTLENADKKKVDIVFQLSNNDIAFRY